ncbi:uncharacterized protein EDB91DRAFT_1166704 [Suillus paluster]|uniref:uncharacterized protein n=1 Tax=Suillus paluster TaxID=48578 RepID=UPI001B85E408|nr:uncharacterized protein EDB91DRAFT_1166704 [Suillus paluster]KAG1726058.1 hypothetical protein EDB91DRAFT_1166704 [Suillus paluster]
MWTEHRNPEGRTYWFNTGSRESVWEKPDDLKTPFEKALGETKWKEYFSGGRKYYYNTESKESKWDMPDELLLLLEKVEKEKQNSQLVVAGSIPTPAAPIPAAVIAAQPDGTVALAGSAALPFSSSGVLPARPNLPDDPAIPHNGFATFEEGEKAFMHLLRKAGVDADWTWDQTMRTIITDPLYKALNSLAEKKASWQKYTDGLRQKEEEEREARLSKLRPAIRNMLKGNPNVFHYTTFATADKLFSQHPIWQQARFEAERKLIFDEYVAELKQREVQETRAARSRAISKVVSLFKELDVDVLTRWRKAHEMLRKLPTLDILLAFEDYSRVKEREFEEQMRRAQVEKTREERKAREAFKGLLQDLVTAGKIKARGKWRHVYPTFASDQRYLNMLGKPGSNPLELFWDVVDTLDQKLDGKIAIAEECARRGDDPNAMDVVKGDKEKENVSVVSVQTTFEEFKARVRRDPDSVGKLGEDDLREVYDTVHEQVVKKQNEEKRRAERRQRHLQDDLRYAMKKLPEPLDITLSYEAAVPLLENLAEYKALDDDEGRRAAFSKFVKRQKERLREAASEDGASTTSRRRKEPERERERDRDRRDDRDRDRDRERDRERERDRDRDRSSRHHHREDHDGYHGRDKDAHGERDRDRERERDRERDRDREREHKRHVRDERDGRDERKRRKGSRERGYGRSDAPPYGDDEEAEHAGDKPERSRDGKRGSDRAHSERAEKRARYDPDIDSRSRRAETPEEGEI